LATRDILTLDLHRAPGVIYRFRLVASAYPRTRRQAGTTSNNLVACQRNAYPEVGQQIAGIDAHVMISSM